jgi:RNA polymerase sigma-70 factor (ECF subfamily)
LGGDEEGQPLLQEIADCVTLCFNSNYSFTRNAIADMGDITQLLTELRGGNRAAEAELVSLVYAQLKRIAARQLRLEKPGRTLGATALVHEAYLRLVRQEISWHDRAHFFALAAQAMRRILVDHARARASTKRGGIREKLELDQVALYMPERPATLLVLDEALQRLAGLDPRQSSIVEMRFFGGLTEDEIAEVIGVSTRTVKREWTMAKAWLYAELRDAILPNEAP